ncbi:hypothetical protein [Methylobacterium organophilum]|uniref:Uncharacterized protein n=1 Tax=Methylobacterium organophilum TaxID=410 RepID=A0ABQ4T8B3_METOR|nr:hypothetical protein [Methylobacterium organophilum]UMY16538.1 hypothetical protein MMB17_17835 [Methylobacterium organophilum]GJE27266.1 hypothetical protein LKMONMHP_2124 [Methylobacterium organophilum]
MTGIDVVFLAPDGAKAGLMRRTISFRPGESVPRIGECVILDFGAEPVRWTVEDVAHVFENDQHGIAVKLALPDR